LVETADFSRVLRIAKNKNKNKIQKLHGGNKVFERHVNHNGKCAIDQNQRERERERESCSNDKNTFAEMTGIIEGHKKIE
jgi:hypothetical protein